MEGGLEKKLGCVWGDYTYAAPALERNKEACVWGCLVRAGLSVAERRKVLGDSLFRWRMGSGLSNLVEAIVKMDEVGGTLHLWTCTGRGICKALALSGLQGCISKTRSGSLR